MTKAFKNLKRLITQLPCSAHYNSKIENILTTDEKTGSETLAETKRRKPEANWICHKISIGYRNKYAINYIEMLAVVWGLEHFCFYSYGKP